MCGVFAEIKRIFAGEPNTHTMAKQLLRRYIWLIDTIRSADGITFEEINSRWLRSSLNEDGKALPKRTFHDHIDAILDEFDIEIACDRNDGYRYRIREYEEYGSIRKTMVDALVLNNSVREHPEIGGRIIFHDQSHGGNLPGILQGLRDRRIIRFRYSCDYSYARETVPACKDLKDICYTDEMAVYGLFFCGIWFVVGKVQSDRKLHIYTLHRLSEIQETERIYDFPEDFDTRQFMMEYKEDMDVLARIHESRREDDGMTLEVYRIDADPSYLL